MFFPYEHNIATTFPLSGKTFRRVSNFSVFKMYFYVFNFSRLARHTSATSQPETLPSVKIIWLVEMFSR
jgi:hypothetical protein